MPEPTTDELIARWRPICEREVTLPKDSQTQAWLDRAAVLARLDAAESALAAERAAREAAERERDAFASEALVALAGAVCTPEKGYVADGGPGLLRHDILALRKQKEAAEYTLERLYAAIDATKTPCIDADGQLIHPAVRILVLGKRVAELEAKLRPFAAMAGTIPEHVEDDMRVALTSDNPIAGPTVGDCRAARRLLEEREG